jgi:hypothetical protein
VTVPAGLLPDHGHRCFDALPGLVERHLTDAGGPEKVVLVWADAFGWRFVERHGDHPLLRRFADHGTLERWTSQFPSTTTPHVVTIHSGLPVGAHGLYEWFVYEPALDRLVCPLRFSFAGDDEPGTLAAAGPAAAGMLPPAQTIYRRLADRGVACHAFQDAAYSSGPGAAVAFAGATVHPYATLADGLDALAAVVRKPGRAYCFLYADQVDAAGHDAGPDSEHFDAAVRDLLDALERWHRAVAGGVGDALLLLTADHGVAACDPATTVYVNREWPEIVALLRHGRDGRPLAPAGSARDLFLHARPGCLDRLVDGLRRLLGDRAGVHTTEELLADGLFGPAPGPRLRERLADVVVLPGERETVWWWEPGRYEQRFFGHHGGLSADEVALPLGTLRLD